MEYLALIDQPLADLALKLRICFAHELLRQLVDEISAEKVTLTLLRLVSLLFLLALLAVSVNPIPKIVVPGVGDEG